jgi:hypothetical protein
MTADALSSVLSANAVRGRVETYAELYQREGERFGVHDTAAIEATPLLPKR